jgi:hypothetical protein
MFMVDQAYEITVRRGDDLIMFLMSTAERETASNPALNSGDMAMVMRVVLAALDRKEQARHPEDHAFVDALLAQEFPDWMKYQRLING